MTLEEVDSILKKFLEEYNPTVNPDVYIAIREYKREKETLEDDIKIKDLLIEQLKNKIRILERKENIYD